VVNLPSPTHLPCLRLLDLYLHKIHPVLQSHRHPCQKDEPGGQEVQGWSRRPRPRSHHYFQRDVIWVIVKL
jgi:hypothetical protein